MSPEKTALSYSDYVSPHYITKERLASYWHQVSEVVDLGARTAACIGPGNRIVPDWLRTLGVGVACVEAFPSPAADVCGDVRGLPVRTGAVDVVLCPQVLEHLPWTSLDGALAELRRVCTGAAVVSLPHAGARLQVRIDRSGRAPLFTGVNVPSLRPPSLVSPEEHHWELDQPGRTVSDVVGRMVAAGFDLRRTYRVAEFAYHRFFVLTTAGRPPA